MKQNKPARTPGYLFEGLSTFLGVVLVGLSLCINVSNRTFLAAAAPAEAVILAMHSAGSERPGTPLVEFTAGGRRYVERLNKATAEMRPGRHITVHYNRRNPHDVRYTPGDDRPSLLSLALGAAFLSLGAAANFFRRHHP